MKDSIIKLEREYRIPRVPNFICSTTEGEHSISVGDLSDSTLEEIITMWTQDFRQNVTRLRENKNVN